ncbi:hypothetical protein PJ15_2391 [Acinetobacter sp. neg1]|nr:hypothetical protein PJ15_2391 [Acinetobacter sp. neg1]
MAKMKDNKKGAFNAFFILNRMKISACHQIHYVVVRCI